VDIHRKPGYDPAELFFDPRLRLPRLRAARFLLRKTLGFRALLDVVPLDPGLVKGSHGLPPPDPLDGPVLLCPETGLFPDRPAMTDVKPAVLHALGLSGADTPR
jgi:hypothetical protein